MRQYTDLVINSIVTLLAGLKVTMKQFFSPNATLQYPEVRPVVSERYRGIHVLDKETCIGCLQCMKACPIDCITIKVTRDKVTKKMTLDEFTLDYNTCMFCHLCIEPCPVECIDMSRTYEFNVFNREDLVVDLLNPQHGWNSTTPDGRKDGRASEFYPGFTPSIFHILDFKPKSHYEEARNVWSRAEREQKDFAQPKVVQPADAAKDAPKKDAGA